jgi:hypothetical protein
VAREIVRSYERKKLLDPCHPLFELMRDGVKWDAFPAALTNHSFESLPLTGKAESHSDETALQKYAEQKAEKFHQKMASPLPPRQGGP